MSRYRADKTRSQICFGLPGQQQEYKTMNLSVIPNKKQLDRKVSENYSLRADDINYPTPVRELKHEKDFIMDTTDIAGTQTKPMVDLNKPAKNLLYIDDIDGAKPRIIRQLPHSKRMINPGDPVYKLPSYKEEDPIYPKFIRDPMKNDDVEGASPKPLYDSRPPKDIMRTDDIIGNHVDFVKTMHTRNTNLDVSDINNDGLFKTRRHTNPLVPEYHVMGQTLENDFGIQDPPRKESNSPYYPLKVDDIKGATADSCSLKFRTFKAPPPPSEDDDYQPAPILMLPTMKKQTAELQRQMEASRVRGEKIRYYENRNLHAETHGSDVAQAILRQQREDRNRRHVNQQQTTFTFG